MWDHNISSKTKTPWNEVKTVAAWVQRKMAMEGFSKKARWYWAGESRLKEKNQQWN